MEASSHEVPNSGRKEHKFIEYIEPEQKQISPANCSLPAVTGRNPYLDQGAFWFSGFEIWNIGDARNSSRVMRGVMLTLGESNTTVPLG